MTSDKNVQMTNDPKLWINLQCVTRESKCMLESKAFWIFDSTLHLHKNLTGRDSEMYSWEALILLLLLLLIIIILLVSFGILRDVPYDSGSMYSSLVSESSAPKWNGNSIRLLKKPFTVLCAYDIWCPFYSLVIFNFGNLVYLDVMSSSLQSLRAFRSRHCSEDRTTTSSKKTVEPDTGPGWLQLHV